MSNNEVHSSHEIVQSTDKQITSSTEELLPNSSNVQDALLTSGSVENNTSNNRENDAPIYSQISRSNPLFDEELAGETSHNSEVKDSHENELIEKSSQKSDLQDVAEAIDQKETAHQSTDQIQIELSSNQLDSEQARNRLNDEQSSNQLEFEHFETDKSSKQLELGQRFDQTKAVSASSDVSPGDEEDPELEIEVLDPDCDIDNLETIIRNKTRTGFDTSAVQLEDPEGNIIVNKIANQRKKKWMLVLGGVALFLIVATAVTVPTTLHFLGKKEVELPVGDDSWIGCPSKNGAINDQITCKSKGCLWQESLNPWPSCHFPPNSSHYLVADALKTVGNTLYITLRNSSEVNLFGKTHEIVTLKVDYSQRSRITVKIYPGKDESITEPTKPELTGQDSPLSSLNSNDYIVNVPRTLGEEFYLEIVRESTGHKIWDSQLAGLVVEEGFLQVGSILPSPHLYGMSENGHGMKLRREFGFQNRPLFNRGALPGAPKFQDRLNRNSVHPFYMNLEDDGRANGVLFKTTYPSEYMLLNVPGIVFRTIGTYLEFVVFVGDSPQHVSQELAQVIGGTPLPPMWALGLHLAPMGDPRPAVNATRLANIPLDAVHMCPSLWEKEMVFNNSKLINQELYPYFKTNPDINWVLTLSPAVHASYDYSPFSVGSEYKYLISWPKEIPPEQRDFPPGLEPLTSGADGSYAVMFGKRAAADFVAFFDFKHPLALAAWSGYLGEIYKNNFIYGGVTMIGNEPLNVGAPEGCLGRAECWSLKCPDNPWDSPPYLTAAAYGHGPKAKLSDGTVCMGAQHYHHKHLEVHNNYGMDVALYTHQACSLNHRCFVISHSTAYVDSHPPNTIVKLLDEKEFSWKGMKSALISVLEFSLLGMPLVASDICGDYQQPDEKLCLRWVQLGAFLPITRTRVSFQDKPQDSRLGILSSSLVKDWARRAVNRRMSLLPYIYSVLFRSLTKGEPLLRPIFYEFPNDTEVRDIDDQFMFGPAFMVAPIMEPNIDDSIEVYFPGDLWYRIKGDTSNRLGSSAGYREVRDIDDIPLFARGGHIVPFQQDNDYKNVQAISNHSITLKVFPKDGEASGFLYVDDGISTDSVTSMKYFYFSFNYEKCQIEINRENSYEGPRVIRLHEIVLNDWDSLRGRFLHSNNFYNQNNTLLDLQVLKVNGNPDFALKPFPDHKMLILEVNLDLRETTVNNKWSFDWSSSPYCLY